MNNPNKHDIKETSEAITRLRFERSYKEQLLEVIKYTDSYDLIERITREIQDIEENLHSLLNND